MLHGSKKNFIQVLLWAAFVIIAINVLSKIQAETYFSKEIYSFPSLLGLTFNGSLFQSTRT